MKLAPDLNGIHLVLLMFYVLLPSGHICHRRTDECESGRVHPVGSSLLNNQIRSIRHALPCTMTRPWQKASQKREGRKQGEEGAGYRGKNGDS